jgi:nucleoside-diphosphate-sugar epimerase
VKTQKSNCLITAFAGSTATSDAVQSSTSIRNYHFYLARLQESSHWKGRKVKVIITGVAGFIGSHTAKFFLESGIRVVGIDSFSTLLYSEALKRQNIIDLYKFPNFELVELDLEKKSAYQYLTGVNAIINFAALPGQALSWESFEQYQNSNLLIVNNLLRDLNYFPEIYFLQISTSSVHGNLKKNLLDAGRSRPISPYGVTKLAAENLIDVYQSQRNLSAGILRLYSVYGPNQRPDMAYAKFCRALLSDQEILIYGDGNQLRSITFVSDVARAVFLAIQSRISGLVADVCGDETISLIQALAAFEKHIGVSGNIKLAPARIGDQSISVGDPSRLVELLNFKTEIKFDEGIKLQALSFMESR